jgi:hypothetical protein
MLQYQTIDPEDMRTLKEQFSLTSQQLNDLTTEYNALKERYDNLEAERNRVVCLIAQKYDAVLC